MQDNALQEAVYRVAEYGGGIAEVWRIPEDAQVIPGDRIPLLHGATFTSWVR